MIQAILAGRKTVTRRVVKPQPFHGIYDADAGVLFDETKVYECPYGQPGDRLWVRETWRYADMAPRSRRVEFKADGDHPGPFPWKPSIHMPRWASRIMLEVTGVRVERLQEITEKGARAEGCHGMGSNGDAEFPPEGIISAVEDFRDLWDSINESRGFGWDKNPWVWVVEFKRVV
jgi:hypothetical protein